MNRRVLWAPALVLGGLLAVLQGASASVFSRAGTQFSVPAHLPQDFGVRVYSALEAFFPLPFVESMLVRAELSRGDGAAARVHVLRMPPSVARSEFSARIALLLGDHAAAMASFLDAGDVDALRDEVARLSNAGDLRGAYNLENATRARLASNATHPDLVAESYWRSGVLASRLHLMKTALRDYRSALTLAPFSEKYLLGAGTESAQLSRYGDARDYFARCLAVDPASADAVAGLGLVALRTGDRGAAQAYAERSRALDTQSSMLATLERALR